MLSYYAFLLDKTGSVYSHHMYQYQHHHQAQHGVGRKVKNKMKSGMSTPLIASSTGLLHAGVSLGVPGGAGDSASPSSNASSVNKLRGYQHFLVSMLPISVASSMLNVL